MREQAGRRHSSAPAPAVALPRKAARQRGAGLFGALARRILTVSREDDALLVRLFPLGNWELAEWLRGPDFWSLELLNFIVLDRDSWRRVW